jgi:hypothetical protein
MFFPKTPARRIQISLAILFAYLMLTLVLSVSLSRDDVSVWTSYGRWIVGVPVCLIAYVAFELFGTFAQRLPFWQRLPSGVRVPLLVLVFGLSMLGLLYFGNAHFTLEVR